MIFHVIFAILSFSFITQPVSENKFVEDHPTMSIAVNELDNQFLHLATNEVSLSSGTKTYVKQNATGAGTGTDWDNALGSGDLVTAIQAGGTIYMAAGIYSPGVSMNINTNTCVIGGFPNSATGTEACNNYDPIANQTIIDGGASHRILRHNNIAADTVELKGLVLRNGFSSATGGAFLSAITFTTPLSFKFIDLEVSNCSSSNHGAFYINEKINLNTEILFSNCNFNSNSSDRGGAISLFKVRNSDSNSFLNPEKLIIEGCTFDTNTASGPGGGAINLQESHQWTFRENTFCANTATAENGGAMRIFSGYEIKIIASEFTGNSSNTDGGALIANQSNLTVSNSIFVGNTTGTMGRGGVIYGATSSGIEIDSSSFYNNVAGSGGAIFWSSGFANLNPNQVVNSIFVNNTANERSNGSQNGGGALKLTNSPWTVANNFFVDNSVSSIGFGGAININNATIDLTNNLFYNNQKGTDATILGADIMTVVPSGNFSPAADNKMQLSSASVYLPQMGTPDGDDYDFTNDTFSNLDDGSLPSTPTITCPSGIQAQNIIVNCPITTEICDNGIDDDGDGFIDSADDDCCGAQAPVLLKN